MTKQLWECSDPGNEYPDRTYLKWDAEDAAQEYVKYIDASNGGEWDESRTVHVRAASGGPTFSVTVNAEVDVRYYSEEPKVLEGTLHGEQSHK